MRIEREFFERDPVVCASELVGCELRWDQCSGIVVETEAYSAQGDEACHTFGRATARTFVANNEAGSAYVYLNYGMYWLLNVLVKGAEASGFVLLRALEPKNGLDLMRGRRKRESLRSICSGPGRLGQALGISGKDHGRDLCKVPGVGFWRGRAPLVLPDVRIGISKAKELPWRFLLADSPFVSVPHSRTQKRPGRQSGLAF